MLRKYYLHFYCPFCRCNIVKEKINDLHISNIKGYQNQADEHSSTVSKAPPFKHLKTSFEQMSWGCRASNIDSNCFAIADGAIAKEICCNAKASQDKLPTKSHSNRHGHSSMATEVGINAITTTDQVRGFKDGDKMIENTYYEGTADLNEQSGGTQPDRYFPDGKIEMIDNTYYDGSAEMLNSGNVTGDGERIGKDNQYVYAYDHFILEGRQRESFES